MLEVLWYRGIVQVGSIVGMFLHLSAMAEHHCSDLPRSDLFPSSMTPFCIKEQKDKDSDLERQMGFYPEVSDTDWS